MAATTETQIKAAEERGRLLLETEPRAQTARYDPATGRVEVALVNGCTYGFPVSLIEDLQNAEPEALVNIEVDGLGFNLHWPALDVDLYVPALVAGIFGTRAWMTSALARVAGRATSAAKATASKTNGAKGGRPRKTAAG